MYYIYIYDYMYISLSIIYIYIYTLQWSGLRDTTPPTYSGYGALFDLNTS